MHNHAMKGTKQQRRRFGTFSNADLGSIKSNITVVKDRAMQLNTPNCKSHNRLSHVCTVQQLNSAEGHVTSSLLVLFSAVPASKHQLQG